MRSARRPHGNIERVLVLVLVGFIAFDLLLIVPAFASELRLDRIHPSLPVVSLRPLADGRARIADELGVELSGPVQQMAGELRKAGAKTFNAVFHEANIQSGMVATQTPVPTDPEGNDAGLPLATSPVPTATEQDSGGGNISTPLPSATLSLSPEATLDPQVTVLPSQTVDFLETSVVETATALALPKKTKLPPPTKTPGPSYTPTSNAVPTDQSPTMTPSQAMVATATAICATGCLPSASPTATITDLPTQAPSPTQSPTAIPTSTLPPLDTHTPVPVGTHSGPLPAFPGAQGWGASSVGGRGGQIMEVTNLNDSGPGSLRAAAEANGSRIVVFRVAGVIRLQSPIRIKQPFITIAGQTSPGSGITLVGERLMVSTHDVIIRYLRWRGDGKHFLNIRPWHDLYNVIVDHCSATWGEDDLVSIWYHDESEQEQDIRKFTFQNCVVAEPLAGHHTGMIVGSTWTEHADQLEHVHHISIHNNLFVHSGHRNPLITALHSEVVNNVMFNWHNRIGGIERASEVDWIGNYFQIGPQSNTTNTGHLRHLGQDYYDWDIVYPAPSLYISGNIAPEQGHDDVDSDNWWMITQHGGPGEGEVLPGDFRRSQPLSGPPFPVPRHSAYTAFDNVISDVGANARLDSLGNWVPVLDSVDQRLISDVQNGSGPSHYSDINKPGEIGPIDPGIPYEDSDHDGMADKWELSHCFDPNDPSDGSQDADGDGYTNIEEFLNGTSPGSGGHC